jgi:geranylgeranyl diphosphate synthase type I
MGLEIKNTEMLQAIEKELQRQVDRLIEKEILPFREMLTYQMGWTGDGCGAETRGKRLRPLLVLFTASACGAEWQPTIPAAAAVELVHNFSLVHDDIQDNSGLRRGRITVWKKWGMPQGINAGDALFVLSNLALFDLSSSYPADVILKCAVILQNTCLELTNGQFMDISYEKLTNLTIENYWVMIRRKTAALLSACCEIGAVLGGADEILQESYRNFGHYLGLAFQVQDDQLGIWGNSIITGKSNNSDLLTGKKTLPVLFGLHTNKRFAKRWREGAINPDEIPGLAELLVEEGALLYTQETSDNLINLALQSLRTADPQGETGEELFKLVDKLANRDS